MSPLSCLIRRSLGGCTFVLFLLPVYADVRNDELFPTERLRVRSIATRTTPISNPIRWPRFEFRVPDGSRVKKDEVVFRADARGTKEAIQSLQEQLLKKENEIHRKTEEMARSVEELVGKLEDLKDEKRIQQARLEYLQSLPLKKNVEIAKGRLEVAELQLAAREADVAKVQEREKAGLVSPAQVEESIFQLNLQKARTLHAKRGLSLAQVTAHPKDLQVIRYRIENLDLEIGKLAFEVQTQEEISGLEGALLEREMETLTRKLEERQTELNHLVIRAPRDGVLMYSTQFKRELSSGGQPSMGMVLAEIPHPDSIAFEGEIPERVRPLYAVGDPVRIVLNASPDQELTGTLSSISPFSREKAEEESEGVKVLDVTVEVTGLKTELPVGVYGWAVLTTAEPRKGPSVPVSWIRIQGGNPHVSVEGLYQPVSGIVDGDRFQFTDPLPPLDKVQEEGEWPSEEQPQIVMEGDRFHTSGELEPLQSIGVKVPRIRAWDMKVTTLHPENTLIEEGQTAAVLDSESLREQAENARGEAEEAQQEKESAEKELQLRIRDRDFQVQAVETKLKIAQLERDLAIPGIRASAVYQSILNLQTAQLRLQHAQQELERLEAHPELTAPRERTRAKREVRRRELEHERADIQLAQAKEGLSEEERSLSELKVLRMEAETVKVRARQTRAVARAQSGLRWRSRRLLRREERQEELERNLQDMSITAPVEGLVKYENIWDGVRRTKLKTGMRVWRGMKLLSLSNTGELYVDISVPERYVQQLQTGMKVQVQIPSEGSRMWKGEVSMLGEMLVPLDTPPVADSLYANREPLPIQAIPVRVLIDASGEGQLKPGAIAHVLFPFEP